MFSVKEQNFIKSLGINVDFENLIDDILIEIEKKVSDILQIKGFDENYNITQIGILCEEILDKLSEFDKKDDRQHSINLKDYIDQKVKIIDINDNVFVGRIIDYIEAEDNYQDEFYPYVETIVIENTELIEFSEKDIKSICFLEEKARTKTENFQRKKICPSCYGNLFYNADTQYYACEHCDFAISEKSLLDGYIYWFCDNCKCFMNVQEGFNTKLGIWNCKRCGFENDVSEKNIED